MNRLEIETPDRAETVLESLYSSVQRRIGSSAPGLCPVDMALNFLTLAHAQTCGKCVPCRVGLRQLTKMIESVLEGEATLETIDQIESTAQVIADTADCAIGYETAGMILQGVRAFRDDYEEHVLHGRCKSSIANAVPCVSVCPAHVDIPGYIALVKDGRPEDAVRLIRKDNPFPSVCAYVCEHPCEARCRRHFVDDGINICGIKRYAVDHAGEMETPSKAEPTGKKVAVVGGGPGGLTCAYYLSLMGHDVTVYDQRRKLGGMLRYGIPDYRLPQDVLDRDINFILNTGVKAVSHVKIGEDIRIADLQNEYDAVYVAIGAHEDKKTGIEGEDAVNCVSAVEMLRDAGKGSPMDLKGKRVCVIGGGNVAMDATRTSLRLGAGSVTCVYRRRIDDMTALPEEIEEAMAEGAHIQVLMAPHHIEKDEEGRVAALWVQPQIISRIGRDGRPSVRAANAEPVRIECDVVIVAIGQVIGSKYFEENGIPVKWDRIQTEKSSYVPNSGNVFAGGDAVSGPSTVIKAVAAGKVAAANIDSFLGFDHEIEVDVEIPHPGLSNEPACGRVNTVSRHIENIEGDFDLVSTCMSDEEAKQECSRCLRCDHFGFGVFKGGRVNKW